LTQKAPALLRHPGTIYESNNRMNEVIEKPKTDTPIRLMLGGRDQRIEGWLNVDLHEGPNVDIKADVSDLSQFQAGSVSELYASHILEHFPHVKTVDVLKEWRRVLKTDGRAYISVPDLDAVFQVYKMTGNRFDPWIKNILYGDQIYPLAFHYNIFTYETLLSDCKEAGFRKFRKLARMPYGLSDCSTLIDNIVCNPISVSIEAIA
jgi:predicted SAM-dependent methyltransferase